MQYIVLFESQNQRVIFAVILYKFIFKFLNRMEQVHMKGLDNYLNSYYQESLQNKIKSTKKIIKLALKGNNILYLLEHCKSALLESLLSVLVRTLNDDHRKSIDLAIYIQCFVLILSTYQQFHPFLTQIQIGKTTLQVLEFQFNKFDLRYSDYIEANRKKTVEAPTLLKKLNLLILKQDKLFYVALSVLRNLAEDDFVQRKMKSAGIISMLIRMLERNDLQLLLKTLNFLKKMVLYSDYKNKMIELGILQKLKRFFTCQNQLLLNHSLSLYKNLCLDKKARKEIFKKDIHFKFVQILSIPPYRFLTIVILYLLSTDYSNRAAIAKTNCINIVIQLIMTFPEKVVGVQLVSLAINLGFDQNIANSISQQEIFGVLDRSIRNEDSKLLKFTKNVLIKTTQDNVKKVFEQYMKNIVKTIITKGGKKQDLLVQLLGICANIPIQNNESYPQYINQTFIDFLYSHLAEGIVDDDIIMQTLMAVSNFCANKNIAELFIKSKIYRSILGLYLNKAEDPEFNVQLSYAMLQFLRHRLGQELIFQQQQVIIILLESIEDKTEEVRSMAIQVLEILSQNDIGLNEQLKQKRYQTYNNQWIESIKTYQKDILNQNMQYQMMMNGVYPFEQDYPYGDFIWDDQQDN